MGQKRKNQDLNKDTNPTKKCPVSGQVSVPILNEKNDILEMQKQIEENEKSIKELIETNVMCKNKMNEMIIKINELTDENNELKEKVRILDENNDIFIKKLQLLEMKINNKEVNSLVKKYMIAIQDYNRLCQIESKIDKDAYQSMLDLKANRHLECHYLNIKYSKKDINDRIYVMKEEITNMPDNIKHIFDTRYPGLIDSVKKILNNQHKDVPSKNSLDIIKDWWHEI